MTGNNNRLWHVLILAAACLAVYFNGLNNEPVYYDREFVVDNAFLRSWKSLPDMIRDLEKRAISDTLSRCSWNRSEAAREMGISYPTLLKKIKDYGITESA